MFRRWASIRRKLWNMIITAYCKIAKSSAQKYAVSLRIRARFTATLKYDYTLLTLPRIIFVFRSFPVFLLFSGKKRPMKIFSKKFPTNDAFVSNRLVSPVFRLYYPYNYTSHFETAKHKTSSENCMRSFSCEWEVEEKF